MSLENKIALITGASRGIGLAILLDLAKKGAYVVGADISEAGLKELTALMKEKNIKGQVEFANVTDAASVTDLLKKMKETCGAPDILVNNAGITRDNLLMRMSEDEWDAVINTNLSSVYKMTKACMRDMMKKRWGRIITIGSIVGVMGNAGQANYCATKAGVIGFSKAVAREIASRNVTVNVVAPGFIDTAMTRALNEEQTRVMLQTIPMNRVGTPEDVAHAVSFLASDDASYITGQTIHVNGGMLQP